MSLKKSFSVRTVDQIVDYLSDLNDNSTIFLADVEIQLSVMMRSCAKASSDKQRTPTSALHHLVLISNCGGNDQQETSLCCFLFWRNLLRFFIKMLLDYTLDTMIAAFCSEAINDHWDKKKYNNK